MTMTATGGAADMMIGPVAANESEGGQGEAVAAVEAPTVWVLCRAREGTVETLRAYDDEARARADLDLAGSVSDDEFWVAAVPFVASGAGVRPDSDAGAPSQVQALALAWLADGAKAEVPLPFDDPVVISPVHVRGFVSVPPHEWRAMEARGWVRDGRITAAGAARIGRDGPPAPLEEA